MSQPCAAPKCERTSRAPCDCCKQHLCLRHLQEHNALLISQLNPLTDEINAIGDRLNRLNFHETAGDCRKNLEEWRLKCHEKIDRFFKQKCQELDRIMAAEIDEQKEKILHTKTELDKLIRQEEPTRRDIDTLTSTIRALKEKINTIEQARFRVNTHPLLIDDTIIEFKKIYELESDLSTLSRVYKTIVYREGSWHSLGSNNRLLLIHQAPNLCFLNTDLTIVKQVLWPYGIIAGICWSSTLARFILTVEDNIFLVDESTMSIERVQTIEKQLWLSCTCFNDQLFLSTNKWGSSIVEIGLSTSIAVVKQWKSPITCTMDELIDHMVYKNGTLAVLIASKVEKSMRMELRSCNTLDRLWSLPLDIIYNQETAFRFCSLDYKGWLVADYNAGCLLYITVDGKMKQTITYKSIPHCLILFTPDMLAISTTSNINFHKI